MTMNPTTDTGKSTDLRSGQTDSGWLLVSDVDDTLLGDDEALGRFVEVYRTSGSFALALNSSRPCAHVHGSLGELPVELEPDAIIGGMGTQIEVGGAEDENWQQRFGGWDRAIVDSVMVELGFPRHPDELQTPFKASYAVPEADWERAAKAVSAAGLPARIIRSGSSDFDVLPPDAGKGAATVYLARKLGTPKNRLIVAGDSANDLQMFAVARRGIVVGNARPELRIAVDPGRVCFARHRFADALIEGLQYWTVPIQQPT